MNTKLFNLANKYIMKQILEVLAQLTLLGIKATLKVLLSIVDDVYQNFINEYGDKVEFKNEKEEAEFKTYFEQTWCREVKRISSNRLV